MDVTESWPIAEATLLNNPERKCSWYIGVRRMWGKQGHGPEGRKNWAGFPKMWHLTEIDWPDVMVIRRVRSNRKNMYFA
jgi:hypothetical protein